VSYERETKRNRDGGDAKRGKGTTEQKGLRHNVCAGNSMMEKPRKTDQRMGQSRTRCLLHVQMVMTRMWTKAKTDEER